MGLDGFYCILSRCLLRSTDLRIKLQPIPLVCSLCPWCSADLGVAWLAGARSAQSGSFRPICGALGKNTLSVNCFLFHCPGCCCTCIVHSYCIRERKYTLCSRKFGWRGHITLPNYKRHTNVPGMGDAGTV